MNGAAFVFVAVCLRLMMKKQPISRWEYVCLIVPVMIFALTKIVYLPLAILLALIPSQGFGSSRRKWLLISGAVVTGLLLSSLWTYKVRHIQAVSTANATAELGYSVNPKRQLGFIARHPIEYATTVLNTYVTTRGDDMEQEFIGILGWLDTKIPLWIVILDILLIAYCLASIHIPAHALAAGCDDCCALVPFLGVTTALYAYNNPVGFPWVTGLQGRYFIPLSPLLVPLTANLKTSVQPSEASLKTIAVSVSTIVLVLSVCVLSYRYYQL